MKKPFFRNTILLVDDEDIFRKEFKEYFDEYNIIEASSGEEAIKILKEPNEIDLVILDVKMSGINGIEVLERIKNMPNNPSTIILTAYSSKDVVLDALRNKADNYLEKPIDVEKTKEVINKLLDARNIGAIYQIGDARGKVERLKVFLRRNCLKKTSLQDAAKLAALSPKYLSRIFKQFSGIGFKDYKLELKMSRAKELLLDTAYNIDQIADKLGYQNSESFMRQFKKITGFTPSGFRKKGK